MVANFMVRLLATLRSMTVVATGAWLLALGWTAFAPAWADVPADVPNVIKFQIDAALNEFQLKAPNVKVLVDEPPTEVDRSLVVVIDEIGIATNPDGGGTAAVRLVPGVVVPSLSGLSPSDAQDQLNTRDLIPSVLSGDPSGAGVTVTDQNVAADSLVAFNTTIGYSLSATPATSPPPAITPSPAALTTTDDSAPLLLIIVGGLAAIGLLVGALTAIRLMRRPRKVPAAPEQIDVRARAPAPPTTHMEPLDKTPSLSLWLDPHRDLGDQVLEEVSP